AHDPLLNRDVALKVPRAEVLVTPGWRERFRREAQAAAGLEHPHIVPVYEAGQAGAVAFLVSAYCPGPTLARWLRERTGPVPCADAAALIAALAGAVQQAHERGVVHRDLKPSNVLLSFSRDAPAEREGPRSAGASRLNDYVPKITDFGLAKFVHT